MSASRLSTVSLGSIVGLQSEWGPALELIQQVELAADLQPSVMTEPPPRFCMLSARTPADRVRRLSEEITTVLRQPKVRDRILELGAEPVGEA